jgi:hypothetical protein
MSRGSVGAPGETSKGLIRSLLVPVGLALGARNALLDGYHGRWTAPMRPRRQALRSAVVRCWWWTRWAHSSLWHPPRPRPRMKTDGSNLNRGYWERERPSIREHLRFCPGGVLPCELRIACRGSGDPRSRPRQPAGAVVLVATRSRSHQLDCRRLHLCLNKER